MSVVAGSSMSAASTGLKNNALAHPGMRATTFGSNREILLTERVSGAKFRELKRGQDF